MTITTRTSRIALWIAVASVAITPVAYADSDQNFAVNALLIPFTGSGVRIGVIEAGDNIPNYFGLNDPAAANSTLPNGNSYLPAANFVTINQAAIGGQPDTPGNHASTVAGVIIGSNILEGGIATDATLVIGGSSTTNERNLNIQAARNSAAKIINLSLGANVAANDGNSVGSKFVDYIASQRDTLVVVAGNEGAIQQPSDSFNSINVGATGVRTATGLSYAQLAPYNSTNVTSDVSPNTGRGRMKTDIVAPGGDPGNTDNVGTVAALPASENRWFPVSGGQYEWSGSRNNVTQAPNTPPVYTIDDINGDGFGDDYYNITDNNAPQVPISGGPSNASKFFPNNPGNNGAGTAYLSGTDRVDSDSLAGTSFAAPVVSGAAALLTQAGTIKGFSNDHRVLKAILLNDADKSVTHADGSPWARATIAAGKTGTKPNPDDGSPVPIKIGLDPTLGTGQLNVLGSLTNYVAGQYSPGKVPTTGWDLDVTDRAFPESYVFNAPISGLFTATLCWDRNVALGGGVTAGTWDPTSTLTPSTLTDLDLKLYRINPDNSHTLVDYSTSDIDNVEHIYQPNLALGNYELDVLDFNEQGGVTYGLAWAVPEPATLFIFLPALALSLGRRRRIT